jgi:hypothetical protein
MTKTYITIFEIWDAKFIQELAILANLCYMGWVKILIISCSPQQYLLIKFEIIT